ncbi:hypothetical protein MTR_3g020560 [Medicago truncatula]|uniref:Uncharacterized protein n=1 Tax=Medicago truncatula TaxID=3880 RepID=G7IW65_MEDTR|nr:hypothetical protein MTR_3g020560 [Medicago truncatula]
MGDEGFGGLTFLHNTKSSSFGGTTKLYWRRVLGRFGGKLEADVKSRNKLFSRKALMKLTRVYLRLKWYREFRKMPR